MSSHSVEADCKLLSPVTFAMTSVQSEVLADDAGRGWTSVRANEWFSGVY